MSSDFYTIPEEEQIERLQGLARTALECWSMQDAEISTLAYRENMTFAVDSPERGKFAFRVHAANYRTDAQVQSELDFIEYLASAGIRTPRVVHADDGASFVMAEAGGVDVPRQCDMFEWIDGHELRASGAEPEMSIDDARTAYQDVGALAAAIFNATEQWDRPAGFSRPVWDAENLIGVNGQWGDWRKIESLSEDQRTFLNKLYETLAVNLEAFGRGPDRFGLTQGDFLAENIFVCPDGIRMIDFDDCGDGWMLFDASTALFDLLGTDFYEPCLEGFVAGFRSERELPEEHLAMLPTFHLVRMMSYLAHTQGRSHLAQSEFLQQYMLFLIEEHGRPFLEAG